MKNESRFCVGFYCVFRSIQPIVVIESFYQIHVKIRRHFPIVVLVSATIGRFNNYIFANYTFAIKRGD